MCKCVSVWVYVHACVPIIVRLVEVCALAREHCHNVDVAGASGLTERQELLLLPEVG